jgi:hypothetical protein
MSNELETLARRAIACKHWEWLPGMLAIMPASRTTTARVSDVGWCSDESDLPDLSDPATLGCLLALVRKAWKQPSISTRYSEYQDRVEWDVPTPVEQERMRDILFFTGQTEAEALVAALEAAP